MDALASLLDGYGLGALFVVLLLKAIGLPLPVPADLLMLVAAARVAEGRLPLGLTFGALLVALVLGGVMQFWLARGPARGLLYRHGRYLGLTPARLDAAAGAVRRSGWPGIGLAIMTPGVRSATVAACGLAGLSPRVFVPGLVLGSAGFLALHFGLGLAGAALLAALLLAVPTPWLLAVATVAAGALAWLAIRWRQRPAAGAGDLLAEGVGAAHEACCPVCLALGIVGRLPGAAAVAAPEASPVPTRLV
jgi:membrane protein DedA with SNARE-associated domain